MANQLEKDLHNLQGDGVLNEETVLAIRNWYDQKKVQNPNRLQFIFGVLGIILFGGGLILIIAHNWDDLNISVKTGIAFLPLLIGQLWSIRVLWKDSQNQVQREMSATWLTASVGICISLVSQIYHLPGNLSGFLFIWIALSIPVVYFMRSAVVSVLCIVGISWFGIEASSGYKVSYDPWWYFLFLALLTPFYQVLRNAKPTGWFTVLHHYAFLISLISCIGLVVTKGDGSLWLFPLYFTFFSLVYSFSYNLEETGLTGIRNASKVLAWPGILILLFIASFREFWNASLKGNQGFSNDSDQFALLFLILIFILALWNLFKKYQNDANFLKDPVLLLFIPYTVLFLLPIGMESFITGAVNLLLLGMGIYYILRGQKAARIGILNLGLAVIAILAICRFFDSNLSFVIRGILFILVGLGFVYFNLQLIRKKNKV